MSDSGTFHKFERATVQCSLLSEGSRRGGIPILETRKRRRATGHRSMRAACRLQSYGEAARCHKIGSHTEGAIGFERNCLSVEADRLQGSARELGRGQTARGGV